MNYYAHTTDNLDKSDWQLQREHLINVSILCGQFASLFGMANEGKIAGLFHDIGKFAERFQLRLSDHTITGINHWSNGAILACELGYPLVAFAIEGHHVGIPNMSDLSALLRKSKSEVFYEKIFGFGEPHISIINKFKADGLELPEENRIGSNYGFSMSLRTRMLFSCLVDADRIDTSGFYNKIKGKTLAIEKFPELNPEAALNVLLEVVKSKSSSTTLGQLRNQTLNDCIVKASLSPRIFTLTAPTGSGKTLASCAFALKHAAIYDKKKIIYVIPFTTIIDQIGSVLTDKDLKFDSHFGEDYILEHHSTLEVDTNNLEKYKISSGNWGNPFILTTSVQFFESLFSNHPSKCRKLHNIPNSVIIFDEVQTLPTHLLKSLLTSVQILVREYNCTVVFSSATVPAFESVTLNSKWNPTEISSNPEEVSQLLKRTDILFNQSIKLTHRELATKMAKHLQCLTVANTKADVLQIFKELTSFIPNWKDECFHLSTYMCAKHRKEIIFKIRCRLQNNLPCRVVSTQLIEAGVDIDFPYGYRVVGPLDSIIQTGGRINREGSLTDAAGNLVMGKLELVSLVGEKSPLGEYKRNIGITQSFLSQNSDLSIHSPATYKEYYRQMYSLNGNSIEPLYVASENFQFGSADEQCNIIGDATVSAIVPYGDGKKYIDLIKQNREIPHWLYRKLQLYSINVYQNKVDNLLRDDIMSSVECGNSTVYIWKDNYYDPVFGAIHDPLKLIGYII